MDNKSLLSNPLLLGFDYLEQTLDRIAKSAADGYPPYNIEQSGENVWRIVLAAAGFSAGDLSVTVENNQLVIQGRQTDEPNRRFIHRGIASRRFQRRFLLADGMRVEGAGLDNGLLTVTLVRPHPSPVIQKIEIASGNGGI
ncbi:MAG: Hsp20 family protein [Sphingomonadales bacterium]